MSPQVVPLLRREGRHKGKDLKKAGGGCGYVSKAVKKMRIWRGERSRKEKRWRQKNEKKKKKKKNNHYANHATTSKVYIADGCELRHLKIDDEIHNSITVCLFSCLLYTLQYFFF